MSGALRSAGRPTATPSIVAFLKAIQFAKQFRLQIFGQVEILEGNFILGVLELLEVPLGRFVLRMVH
jgi:hypothetical protein